MYDQQSSETMILRDHLARDRTMLANERTLLAYLRTSFGLLAGGGTLIKLFPDDPWLPKLGMVLLALGGFVAAFGTWRFFQVHSKLKRIGKRESHDTPKA